MMKFFGNKPAIFQRADFLSPKDLLQRAAAIGVIFLLLHLAGLREFTSILNGTVGSVALGWKLSAFLAVIYIIAYLAFVVLVPVLILAAIILALWERFRSKNRIESEKRP
jgi:uncharacterized membrane protein YeaQ/YmgE (transglycosylase-associated protein family)